MTLFKLTTIAVFSCITYIYTDLQKIFSLSSSIKIHSIVQIDYNKTIKHLFCTYIYTENQNSCPVAGVPVSEVSVRRVNGDHFTVQ